MKVNFNNPIFENNNKPDPNVAIENTRLKNFPKTQDEFFPFCFSSNCLFFRYRSFLSFFLSFSKGDRFFESVFSLFCFSLVSFFSFFEGLFSLSFFLFFSLSSSLDFFDQKPYQKYTFSFAFFFSFLLHFLIFCYLFFLFLTLFLHKTGKQSFEESTFKGKTINNSTGEPTSTTKNERQEKKEKDEEQTKHHVRVMTS